MTYFVAIRSGEGLDGATAHADRACAADGSDVTPRPVFKPTVEATGATFCAECTNTNGTCEVVKSDGEVCGRERPCPYHD